jgi:hypothetical protein
VSAVDPVWVLCGLLVLLCLVLLGLWRSAEARGSRRSRRRTRRAVDGEAEAEDLLLAAGFTILDRQHGREGRLWVDGEELVFGVRVDLLVERDGESFVAEVKTGSRAPDPCHGPTRRQLREYAELFPECGVLLVDIDEDRILEVDFPAAD